MERHVLPMNVYYANFRLMKNIFLSLLVASVLLPGLVMAAQTPTNQPGNQSPTVQPGNQSPTVQPGSGVTINNPLKVNSITELFVALLEVLLIFAVPIVVFFIILAGFRYVTARGDTNTITEAHRALLYAVIGGVLILGANLLIQVIQATVTAVAN